MSTMERMCSMQHHRWILGNTGIHDFTLAQGAQQVLPRDYWKNAGSRSAPSRNAHQKGAHLTDESYNQGGVPATPSLADTWEKNKFDYNNCEGFRLPRGMAIRYLIYFSHHETDKPFPTKTEEGTGVVSIRPGLPHSCGNLSEKYKTPPKKTFRMVNGKWHIYWAVEKWEKQVARCFINKYKSMWNDTEAKRPVRKSGWSLHQFHPRKDATELASSPSTGQPQSRKGSLSAVPSMGQTLMQPNLWYIYSGDLLHFPVGCPSERKGADLLTDTTALPA